MANTPVTRIGELAQKKVKRIFAAPINAAFFAAAKITPTVGTTDLLLVNLPEFAVITDAYVVVDTAANSATTATVAVGTTEGGEQVLAATSVDTVPATGVAGTLVAKQKTGTGVQLYAALVFTGATTNFGDFTIVIEYTEYDKNTGEYTKF